MHQFKVAGRGYHRVKRRFAKQPIITPDRLYIVPHIVPGMLRVPTESHRRRFSDWPPSNKNRQILSEAIIDILLHASYGRIVGMNAASDTASILQYSCRISMEKPCR